MMPMTIHKVVEIQAPADRVWRYVGTEAGLRKWWGIDITLEAKQGGHCEERSLFNGKLLYLSGEVTVYDPPHQLILLLRREGETEAWPAFTTISITLKQENDRTVVTLEHQAIGPLPVEYATGWTLPQIQAPAPERHAVLNQLPSGDLVLARQMVHQPMRIAEKTWFRTYEMRWDSCLDKLQQIANEA
jgi:uncharacterized protein YndB with AHSA1/START domain